MNNSMHDTFNTADQFFASTSTSAPLWLLLLLERERKCRNQHSSSC